MSWHIYIFEWGSGIRLYPGNAPANVSCNSPVNVDNNKDGRLTFVYIPWRLMSSNVAYHPQGLNTRIKYNFTTTTHIFISIHAVYLLDVKQTCFNRSRNPLFTLICEIRL